MNLGGLAMTGLLTPAMAATPHPPGRPRIDGVQRRLAANGSTSDRERARMRNP